MRQTSFHCLIKLILDSFELFHDLMLRQFCHRRVILTWNYKWKHRYRLLQHMEPAHYTAQSNSDTTSNHAFIHQLVQQCYNNQTKLIKSPQSIAYRHKMTYDFSYIRLHGVSELGLQNVNALCLIIYEFAYHHPTSSPCLPISFWTEMMVQYSRKGKYIIKLCINPKDDDQYNTFTHVIGPQLIQYLLTTEKYGNDIDTIVYQKCPSHASKPSKYDPYHVLYGDGTVSHSTAVFDLPLSLSCNTFCEPNLPMEHQQFLCIREWLQDLLSPPNKQKQFTLIAKGREIIPYICEIHHQLDDLLDLVIAIAPCKRVYHDACHNLKNYLIDVPFHCYYSDHRDNNDMTQCCDTIYTRHIESHGDTDEKEIIFMITAGRNGLALAFVQWIKSLPNVDRIIYSSCNPKITFREMQWFLYGEDGFIIDDYRVLEMHPSTAYNTFFTCLKKKRKHNKTLILPIGGYKVGKTYFIEQHLQQQLASIGQEIVHLNRDALFYGFKANGVSFKKAKQWTHDELNRILTECDANVLYLDSTNTQRDARLFYCQQFAPHKVIFINFVMDSLMDNDALLQEMVERGNAYRMEHGIPVNDTHLDNDKMVKMYRSVCDNMQIVDELELKKIKQLKQYLHIMVLNVNAKDFYLRENLCYNVFHGLFCNVA
eukprot:276966_1